MIAITDNSYIVAIFCLVCKALDWAVIKQKFTEYIDRTLKRPRVKAYILQKWQGFALTEKKAEFILLSVSNTVGPTKKQRWGSILFQHFHGRPN